MSVRKRSAIATVARLKAQVKLTRLWTVYLHVLLYNHGDLLTEPEWQWIASVKQPGRENIHRLRLLTEDVQRRGARRATARLDAIAAKAASLDVDIPFWPPSLTAD
jgi:hypothetical protein